PYSGFPPSDTAFPYGAITLYGAPSQALPVSRIRIMRALQPRRCRNSTGLGSSRFARHYSGNHCYFLFLRVLRCFSSPGSPPCGYHASSMVGCPIRTPADQLLFADPRRLSQLIASFVASESLGIPHTPLFTSFAHPLGCSHPFCMPGSGILPQGRALFRTRHRIDTTPRTLVTTFCHNMSKNLYSTLMVKPVEDNGFEPLPPCVQGRCSSQLS